MDDNTFTELSNMFARNGGRKAADLVNDPPVDLDQAEAGGSGLYGGEQATVREPTWGDRLRTTYEHGRAGANILGAEATLHVPHAIAGGMAGVGKGAYDLIRSGGDFGEAWESVKEGYDMPFAPLRDERAITNDLVETGLAMASGGPATMMGKGLWQAGRYGAGKAAAKLGGAPGMAEDAAQQFRNVKQNSGMMGDAAETHRRTAAGSPNRFSWLKDPSMRTWREAKTGAGMEFVNTLLATGQLDEGVWGSFMGALGGAGGQIVLGEVAPWLAKYALGDSGPFSNVGTGLYDAGPGMKYSGSNVYDGGPPVQQTGVRPQPVVDAVKNLEDGQYFADTTIPGERREELVHRLAQYAAEVTFPHGVEGQPGMSLMLDSRNYARAMDSVLGFVDKTNENLKASMDATLGAPVSNYHHYQQTQGKLSNGRMAYRQLTDVTGLGGTKVDFNKAQLELQRQFLKNLGNYDDKKGVAEQFSNLGGASPMYSEVLRMFRGATEKESVSGEVGMLPTERLGERQTIPPTTLSTMIDTRRRIAEKYLDTGSILRGVNKSQRRDATMMLKSLDDMIVQVAGDRLPETARKEFATYLGQDDAFRMGKEFQAKNRALEEDPESGKNIIEFFDGLPADQKETFVRGYESAIVEDMHNRSPMEAMQNIFGGRMGKGVPRENWFNVNAGNEEVLRHILKPAQVEALKKIYNEDAVLADYSILLANVLHSKARHPTAITDAQRDMDELIMTNAVARGGIGLLSNAVIGAAGRVQASSGPAEASVLMNLLGMQKGVTDGGKGDLVDYLTRVNKGYTKPSKQKGGGYGAQAVSSGTREVEEAEEEESPSAGLMEALDWLGRESADQ